MSKSTSWMMFFGLWTVLAALGGPAWAEDTAVAEPGYQLGPEDALSIFVWKEDGLKQDVLVRPDGGISFPLAGDFSVKGMTADQVREELTKRLSKLIADPVVSVSVIRVQSNKIYVLGKVNKPGEFPVGRYVDVLQALSIAGGPTPFAEENNMKILRRENGKQIVMPFEYAKALKGNHLDQNIMLRGGDIILVP